MITLTDANGITVTEDRRPATQPRPSVLVQKYRGRTVLAIGSHPNDIESGAGGTLARLSDEGARIVMVVVCIPHHVEERMAEARRSAKILGADIQFFYPDTPRRVEDVKHYELVERIDRLVRELDPGAVFTHAASNFHLDNVLVHKACGAAQRLHFFDMLCFYPTNCHPVTTEFRPTLYVDITTTVDRKMAAINEYKTQFSCRGIATDVYHDAAKEYGRMAGVAYAEGLEVSRFLD